MALVMAVSRSSCVGLKISLSGRLVISPWNLGRGGMRVRAPSPQPLPPCTHTPTLPPCTHSHKRGGESLPPNQEWLAASYSGVRLSGSVLSTPSSKSQTSGENLTRRPWWARGEGGGVEEVGGAGEKTVHGHTIWVLPSHISPIHIYDDFS